MVMLKNMANSHRMGGGGGGGGGGGNGLYMEGPIHHQGGFWEGQIPIEIQGWQSAEKVVQWSTTKRISFLVKAIGLWVVSTGHAVLHICQLEEASVDLIDEFPPLIGLNDFWPSVSTECVEQKVGNTFSTFYLQWCGLRPL